MGRRCRRVITPPSPLYARRGLEGLGRASELDRLPKPNRSRPPKRGRCRCGWCAPWCRRERPACRPGYPHTTASAARTNQLPSPVPPSAMAPDARSSGHPEPLNRSTCPSADLSREGNPAAGTAVGESRQRAARRPQALAALACRWARGRLGGVMPPEAADAARTAARRDLAAGCAAW